MSDEELTEYYVYPDGSVCTEPQDYMSDDYVVIEATSEELAYFKYKMIEYNALYSKK